MVALFSGVSMEFRMEALCDGRYATSFENIQYFLCMPQDYLPRGSDPFSSSSFLASLSLRKSVHLDLLSMGFRSGVSAALLIPIRSFEEPPDILAGTIWLPFLTGHSW